jgi:transposase
MSVRGLQREMHVAWSTIWDAVKKYLGELIDNPDRNKGIQIIGVDEHVWHHSWNPEKGSKYQTGIFDLTKDETGKISARLIDLVPSRTTFAYESWLKKQSRDFIGGIKIATLDPYRGYRRAIENTFDDITVAVDPFHIVKLASKVLDEVRCRLQNTQTGHRGRRGDPLYGVRKILISDPSRLTEKQSFKLTMVFKTSDPDHELWEAYKAYQQLRSVYNQNLNVRKRFAVALKILNEFGQSSVKEIRKLGRTLNRWREQFLNYFRAGKVSNGGAEALNGIIELHRRIGRGFTNPENYRLRMLAACGGLF